MTATLGELPLDDLLSHLATRRATGTLSVSTPRFGKKLYLLDGQLGGVSSNDPRELLGHFLVGWGLIDAEQLGEAMRIQERLSTPLGRIVERMGLVDAESLERALVAQAEEVLLDLFLTPILEQRFLENVVPAGRPLVLKLSLPALVLEGQRRRQRADELQRVLGGLDAVPRRVRPTTPAGLSGRELHILAEIDAQRDLNAIALACHVVPFHVAEFVARGVVEGMLALSRPATAAAATTVDDHAETAHRALAAGDLRRCWEALEQLRRHGDSEGARVHAERIERHLADAIAQTRITGQLVPLPAPAPSAGAMAALKPAEAFVLSRINRSWTLREIQRMTPLEELHFGVIVYTLLREGVIELQRPPTKE